MLKTPKWLDLIHLLILKRVKEGKGLSNVEVRDMKLTRAFQKLSKHGYIEGLYYIGYKTVKEGSRLTEKGKEFLSKFETENKEVK